MKRPRRDRRFDISFFATAGFFSVLAQLPFDRGTPAFLLQI